MCISSFVSGGRIPKAMWQCGNVATLQVGNGPEAVSWLQVANAIDRKLATKCRVL